MQEDAGWNAKRVEEIVAAHAHREGPLLPILHALQAAFGYVPRDAIPIVAHALNLTRAEVYGVVTFYHDFRDKPAGHRVLKLCRAEACQAMGGRALADAILQHFQIGWGETSADGAVTIEPVYCLGLCSVAPAALVDGEPHGRLNAHDLIAMAGEGQMTRVFVPGDSAALAVGADAIARVLHAIAQTRKLDLEIVRTGSRGLHWLEPLIEVETAQGRVGYGPLKASELPALVEAGMLEAKPHASCIGVVDQHPWLKRQTRVTFARCGIVDPLMLYDWTGLGRAREIGATATIETVTKSGLRGRGGAGFPTGVKWKSAAEAKGERKYIVCNADEGDSGTFADRMIMEDDPFTLIEGMAIAAFAVGADKGYVYSRAEYPHANAIFEKALAIARYAERLGPAFDIELRVGAGSYVCGEETALLESLEGKRGQVRAKPPLPVHEGLFGKPTVVNNVLSLATAPWILTHGAEAYAAIGFGKSRGTMPIQLAGNVKHAGLFEAPFGITLGELVDDVGGGTASGRPVRAVQCGGPLGAYFPRALFDTPYDFEAFTAADGLIGHGGIVVFDDTVDMGAQARFAMEFCAIESCGKCTPCRIGSTRGVEVIDRILRGEAREANIALVEDLCRTLKLGSLCALGGFTPYPVLSALRHFPEDFGR